MFQVGFGHQAIKLGHHQPNPQPFEEQSGNNSLCATCTFHHLSTSGERLTLWEFWAISVHVGDNTSLKFNPQMYKWYESLRPVILSSKDRGCGIDATDTSGWTLPIAAMANAMAAPLSHCCGLGRAPKPTSQRHFLWGVQMYQLWTRHLRCVICAPEHVIKKIISTRNAWDDSRRRQGTIVIVY
jgi:hypothetical protein